MDSHYKFAAVDSAAGTLVKDAVYLGMKTNQSLSVSFTASIMSVYFGREISLCEAVELAKKYGHTVELTGDLHTSRIYGKI